MDGFGVHCGDCNAHFSLDPSGDIAGAACSECGGKRFFRDQPNPVHSEGTLRDMVDSDSQKDQGGNPLGEGVIMGNDGEKPAYKRDNFMHGKTADWSEHLDPSGLNMQGIADDIMAKKDRACPQCNSPMHFREGSGLTAMHPNGAWECSNQRCWHMIPGDETAQADPHHPDPWMDNEPGSLTFPQQWTHAKVAYPIEPPMLYEQTDIPPGLSLENYNRTRLPGQCQSCGEPMSQFLGRKEPYCGNCLAAHPELAQPHAASISTNSVAQRVEPMSRTLNMDPYPFLWDESYLPAKTAGPLAALPALGELASAAAPWLMKGALMHAGGKLLQGILPGGGGGQSDQGNQGATPDPAGPGTDMPTAAPTMEQLGSVDIPWLLTADMDTPHSVKSVGEQHDDPQDVDQKEFNDGESDPNPDNPNLDDSGANGEDEVKAQDGSDPHTGFHPDSPSIERMMMVLPLLLHYFNSPDSGESDPIIRGLHDALEQENPGYLNKQHPDGEALLQQLMQHHKQPQGVHAGVNAMPGGLPATATPIGLGGNPGGGTCPNCGGTLAGDGSCPQCGAKGHPQGGMQGPGLAAGGPSMPPNHARTATHTGPVTPEQIAAVQQLLLSRGKDEMIPDVPLHPENYAKEMDEIQGEANTAPLVDPSQLTPPPQPPPGAPGSMPMPDPSQAGPGGQPMQPMSHTAADSVAPRCPECKSGTTGLRNGGSAADVTAECAACGHIWTPPKVDMNKYKSKVMEALSLPNANAMFAIPPMPSSEAIPRRKPTARKSKIVLTDLVNPLLENAADQHRQHERGQDSSLTFQDDQGQPLIENQIYELKNPAYALPDEVRVVYVHPNEVGLEPVGYVQNDQGLNGGGDAPIKLTPQMIQMQQYTFTPSAQVSEDNPQTPAQGTTPGQEHIPESGQTTDEHTNSYPNTLSHATGAVVAAVAAQDDDYVEPDENICHKCGSEDINHHMSSATTTMHDCYRCGAVWETRDDFQGREAGSDLNWILNESGPGNDDFFAEMERAKKSYGGSGSRSLSAAAARDPRYEQVREVLEHNKQARVAGRHFTPGEQRDLINEDGTARNADRLNLVGTHYEARADHTGKANGANVPPEHLMLGI